MQTVAIRRKIEVGLNYGTARKIVGALLAISGCIAFATVLVVARADDRKAEIVAGWPLAHGKIVDVRGILSWRLQSAHRIEYEYSVNRRSYISDRIRVGNDDPADYLKYAAGENLLVRFNPRLPAESYIEPTVNQSERFSGITFSLALMALGFLFIYLGIWKPSVRF